MKPPPPLQNDCFALPAGVNWTKVQTALDILKSRLTAVAPMHPCPLGDAAGRILAQDITAPLSHPAYSNSAVDGYGIAGALGEGAQEFTLIQGRAAAGAPFNGTVTAGQALRILTGAKLPDGVQTIILQEDVTISGNTLHIVGPLKKGANIRPLGEDMQHGQRIFEKGHRITAGDIGVLATLGIDPVPCLRPLRVAVLSTGDELIDPSAKIAGADAAIYDANRAMLLAMLRAWGLTAIDCGIIPDNAQAAAAALTNAAQSADAIITSGGASAGDEDHISKALNDAGSMTVWRIAIKPGRPLAMGIWEDTPVFGLPGNPVAAFVCTLLFAKPSFDLMGGGHFTAPQGFYVPAAFSKSKKQGRMEYLRAKIIDDAVHIFPSEGSGRVSSLSWAGGLVELGDDAQTINMGDMVRFIPFASFGLT